jgi:hypothetical protein
VHFVPSLARLTRRALASLAELAGAKYGSSLAWMRQIDTEYDLCSRGCLNYHQMPTLIPKLDYFTNCFAR